jgi:hypothetical protein
MKVFMLSWFVAALVLLMCASLWRSPAAAAERGGQPLEPQLIGTWYWEASSYISTSGDSILIKTVNWVTIQPNGQFSFTQQTTHNGNFTMTGHVEKIGNTLKVIPKVGPPFSVTYKLSGNNGLWIDNKLYEKK